MTVTNPLLGFHRASLPVALACVIFAFPACGKSNGAAAGVGGALAGAGSGRAGRSTGGGSSGGTAGGGRSSGGSGGAAGSGATAGAEEAGADSGGAAGAPGAADLTWALACQQPMFGVLQGEPGPPLTRTALGVSAPGVCEMNPDPQGTMLIEFQEMSEHSRVTLLADGWTIQEVSPESGITITTAVPNVADGFLDNTDYTLRFAGPPPAMPISMLYRSGSGQVSITLSSP